MLKSFDWEKVSFEIAKELPFLAGCLIGRPINTDGDAVYMLFTKEEKMLAKIADTYLPQIQKQFNKITGSDKYELRLMRRANG